MLLLVTIIILVGLELFSPFRPMSFIKKGFWVDLIWYQVIQGFLLQVFIYKFIDRFFSGSNLHLVSSLPGFAQFIIVFIVIDFVAYWIHRIQHYGDWLWRIHEVHHSTVHLNWLSANRIHVLESVMVRVIAGALLVVFGASDAAMYVFSAVQTVMGYLQHANVNFRFGFLNYIFNTPEMHRIHHLSDLRCQRSNFSDKLSVWDWIFGTAYLPKAEDLKDIPFGIGYEYPQHVPGQLFYMFRKRGK